MDGDPGVPIVLKRPPDTKRVGEHIEYEDGSVWRVEQVGDAGARVRCVLGSGKHQTQQTRHDRDGNEVVFMATAYRGHHPGEAKLISAARAGTKFVEKPGGDAGASVAPVQDVASEPPKAAQEVPVKERKVKENKPKGAKVAKAKAVKVAKPKAAKAKVEPRALAKRPAGAKKMKDGYWTEAQVDKARELHKTGASNAAIAEKLGLAGPKAAWRLLNSLNIRGRNPHRVSKRVAVPRKRSAKAKK